MSAWTRKLPRSDSVAVCGPVSETTVSTCVIWRVDSGCAS